MKKLFIVAVLFLVGCTSNMIATDCHKVQGLKASVCRTTYPTQSFEEDND